ncbi:hypothetical protein M446_6681 [Methylobacterium sp. 4-46]|uniref:DUF3572 domain-containing protein n=1 Tax=unclassified Methylobacterium TaxID=2615210 RepID=UPI000152D3BF|nr:MULTISPECIES: DUF3572 domain-containing protein [Methylobacterium]ACA20932.1 hypothetical protein M446_6681 [Methylobacterium sp. 4-46]WFT80087.1 DUF3572 domain-containing protein [Methylobacterium nodulans]
MKRKSPSFTRGKPPQRGLPSRSEAEGIAAAVFAFVTADPGRLMRFMEGAGLSPSALREAAESPELMLGLLDHVVSDEDLLLACARAVGEPPERITLAWRRLGPPDPDSFGADPFGADPFDADPFDA